MNDYNRLTYNEIETIVKQVVEGIGTINGDTAEVTLTARQVAILLQTYGNRNRPEPEDNVFANIQYMLKESPEEESMYE